MKLNLGFHYLLPNLLFKQPSPSHEWQFHAFSCLTQKTSSYPWFLFFTHSSSLSANLVGSIFRIHISGIQPLLTISVTTTLVQVTIASHLDSSAPPTPALLPISVYFQHHRQNDPVKRNQVRSHSKMKPLEWPIISLPLGLILTLFPLVHGAPYW